MTASEDPAETDPRRYLAVHVTYRCPAACSHCCFSSDLDRRGHIEADDILRAVDEAARVPGMWLIAFTGGEPLLHPDLLRTAIARAQDLDIQTRVVTSAFWATSPGRARAVLQPLVDAGLGQLSMSYDDAHAPFVPADRIRNAWDAAEAFGLGLAVAVVEEPGCVLDRAAVCDLLGTDLDDTRVIGSWISSVGRALDGVDDDLIDARNTQSPASIGPCPHVLRGTSITAEGNHMACCGTIPFREGLRIGRYPDGPALDAQIEAAREAPVMQWLAYEGPAAILEHLTAEDDEPIGAESVSSICHACDRLFGDPQMVARLDAALPDKIPSLRLQRAIYDGLGIAPVALPPR